MANEKIVKARQRQKTDTTANWANAKTFVPLKGEIIVYQDPGAEAKFKIGDGTSTVGQLEFVSGGLTSEDIDATLSQSGKAADAKAAGDSLKGLETAINNTNKNITSVTSRVVTAESNISSLQSTALKHATLISNLETQVDALPDSCMVLKDGKVQQDGKTITIPFNSLNGVASKDEVIYAGEAESDQMVDVINVDTLGGLPAESYATKTYVAGEIAKAELGGGGDIDVSGLATKQDLVDLIDSSLTISGKAADAKVVGDKINSLDTIVAIDENSDGNIVLRPYLGENGSSDNSKIDSEYGTAKYLTNRGWFSLISEETETGCTFLNDFDYENDEPYLEILGDNDEAVRLGNISAPVSELDVVNKQYADGEFLKKENGIATYLVIEGDIVIRPEEQEDGVYLQGSYVNGEYAVLNIFGTYTDEPVAICNIADPITPHGAVPLGYANEHYAPKRSLIWENSDPAAPFESTDFTADTLNFDGVEVVYILSAQDLSAGGYGADVRTTGFLPFIKGYEDESINVRLSNYENTANRYILINKESEEINFNNTNGSDNAYLIPVYIYGINI